MLAKQQILLAALVAQAAAQYPTCVTSCVRQSGCAPTDVDCMCKKASGTFLSDVVICMNQWCDASTKFSDLLGPMQAKCDVPQSAISAAEAKAGFDTGSDSTPSATSKASSTGSESSPSVSMIMSVGEPNKIDGSTSAPQVTGSATKASSPSSAVYSDSTAVITATSHASESLLVAATTLTSAASATSTSTSEDSNDGSGSSDGSPAGGHTGDSSATASQASLLAAVLAVGAAISFGW
ncbi:uncharacterized protein F4807DRAFT_112626 [Annulohypoxylon truncatum]|uniref:uncharacterized protein n=1 Tax=Annulohypoxylon truncatum TaxID=327061 RepID=UPI002007DB56|nr:uncharacterized protein F4807DRAFT_112626 [Annulohypoxylon truncatum]KAI1214056.1 hypothetical protein F4807DRAFT_112626 [Annulohypoxylon truncatum]